MLERVPAAAESTAHFFLRSVEKPVRSSRVLDPRFWRNGVDQFETSTWWPSYLQRIRTIPQAQQSILDDSHVSSCPPQQRRASSNVLRSRPEPLLHTPVTVQAQQTGTTLRSYSVSAKRCQSAGPRVAEDIVDDSGYGQNNSQKGSQGISQQADRPNRNKTKVKTSSKAQTRPQSVRSNISSLNGQVGRGARVIGHDLNGFDLGVDTNPDWLGDGIVEQQSLPSRQTVDRQSSATNTSQGGQSKDKGSSRKLSGGSAYQTFDLESLHRASAHSYKHAFDLDAVLQQERASHSDYLAATAGLEQLPDESHVLTESHTKHKPYSEANIHTGWYNSNAFAALVPEEDVEPDEPLSKSLTPDLEEPISEDDTLLQHVGQDIERVSSSIEAKEPFEKTETSIESFDRELQTITRNVSKMASSLEARAVTEQAFEPPATEQDVPVLSSELETEALQSPPQDPKRARFETLLKVRTPAETTTEVLDEAWSLFLSFDNQEALAPYVFRLLNQSSNDRHLSRALAAFNTIPRPRRTRAMYNAAMDIEVKRHQHGSAMNLAFEANIKGFNILPDLLAYLVKSLLWNSVAEVLHRNKHARKDFAQFAPVPELSATAPQRMLSMPELMISCSNIPDLHAKVLSLAERVQSSDSAFTEHIGLLKMLLQRLVIQVVESEDRLTDVSPQALISILDLEDSLGYLALHNKALSTLFRLPSSSDKSDLGLMVYRNFRFKHPNETPNPRIINGLISLCGNADQSSVKLYDYLLEQFPGKPEQKAYHNVMAICARSGDITAVEKYLERFIRHHGKPSRAALVNPLIYAYAVVGDVSNAREQLKQLPLKYNLEPDIVSWNMLMLAHVRSEDDVSAFEIQEEMRLKNVKFNHYTYGQLLAVCASHGDIEAALDVLVDARDDAIEITVPMIHTIVETYLKNDNPQAALRFAMTAVGSEDKEHVTRLWNSFIRYFSFKGNLTDLMKIRDVMARYGVKPDGMTYAPIMTLLTSMQRTSEAMQLLRRMHAEEKLPATMFHYSIILHGFIAEGNRDMAAIVFSEMEQRFPEISASTHSAMVYLQSRRDVHDDSHGPTLDKSHGLKMLADLLKDTSSVKGSLFNLMSPKPQKNGAAISMYFETIVRALIRSGYHESAAQLMKRINVTLLASSKFDPSRILPSKGMVLAQLDIAMERQDWAEFDRIFHDVFQNALKRNSAIPIARRNHTTENDEPNKTATAPSHAKYSLSSYFNRYMEAMARQFRQRSMVKFFRTNLSRSGFVFTGRNWNKYIQVLCRSRQSQHQLQAFRIFERTMMRKTQSWKLLARGKLKKTTTSYLWQPYGQRNRPILQKRNTYRLVKRSDELRFHPERRTPTYLTAVHLGAVLIQAHFRVRRGLKLQFDLIRRFAPRTRRFIQFMPRLKDGIQGSILRQLDARGNMMSRPRSERSIRDKTDLAGIMGNPSPLNQIPNQFLDNIEEVIGRGNLLRSLLKDNQTSKGQLEQDRTDVELGELLTGQISRAPIILAGKGRLETVAEMKRRVSGEERQKQWTVERLREDLRIRQLTGDIYHPSLQVGPPLDISDEHETDMASHQANTSTELQPVGLEDAATLVNPQTGLESSSTNTLSQKAVQQQLDELAEERQKRNEADKETRPRAPQIPQLAVPYMNLRRLRRRVGLRQRRKARQLLEEMKDQLSPRAYTTRVSAADRLEKYERDRRRRQAVLAYERDLKAGKRLDPFPQTDRGVIKRKFKFGAITVRFVPILGRNSKNYAVRRGKLNDPRQRQIQTVPSKGMNYITRYERMEQWMEARYGPRRPNLNVEESESTGEGEAEGQVQEPGQDGGAVRTEESGEDVYRPFSK